MSLTLSGSLGHGTHLQQLIKWRQLKWPLVDSSLLSPEGRINLWGSYPQLNAQVATKLSWQEQDNWQINGTVKGTLLGNGRLI